MSKQSEFIWAMSSRLLLLLAAVIASCAVVSNAKAQTFEGDLTIRWTNPVQACSDTTPPVCEDLKPGDLTAINIYIADAPIPDDYAGPPTLVVGPVTEATHTLTVSHGQKVYVRARALKGNIPSRMSNEDSKTFLLPLIPGAPQEVTIELRLRVALPEPE